MPLFFFGSPIFSSLIFLFRTFPVDALVEHCFFLCARDMVKQTHGCLFGFMPLALKTVKKVVLVYDTALQFPPYLKILDSIVSATS